MDEEDTTSPIEYIPFVAYRSVARQENNYENLCKFIPICLHGWNKLKL